MNNDNYISKDNTNDIDEELINKIQKNGDNIYFKVKLRNALKLIQSKLEDDDEIEFYCSGRNYSSDIARIAFAGSIALSTIGHPIFGWSDRCILIKTHKKIILVEMQAWFDYATHYVIEKNVHLVKKKDNFYLIFRENKKKTIMEINNERYDTIINNIKDRVNIIEDKKLNVKALIIPKIIAGLFWILFIYFIGLFIFLTCKYGTNYWK